MLKNTFTILLSTFCIFNAGAQKLTYTEDPVTKCITALCIDSDTTSMNWLTATNGKQYKWINEKYQWGKVYANMKKGLRPDISVSRHYDGDDIVETYTFTNRSDQTIKMENTGIYTPFNDNYPNARTCMTNRCNVHIWPGGTAAYVKAMRMNGRGPHLGLMVTEGAITDYDIWERGQDKGKSNVRGIIALCPPDMTLKPGASYRIQWRLFVHNGYDFAEQIRKRGGTVVKSDKYVYKKGEKAAVDFTTRNKTHRIKKKLTLSGETRVEHNGTWTSLLVIDDMTTLVDKRADFILDHQQMTDRNDKRYGAFMAYDNEGDTLLTNSHGRSDLDEGRERVGMGIFLAEYAMLLTKQNKTAKAEAIKKRLMDYASFIREQLQTDNYTTTSSVTKKPKNRGYNYAWVADFYFRMSLLTGDATYARHGYGTLKALYRMFGHGFYCIDYPVTVGLKALEKAGMKTEQDSLLCDFKRTADIFVKNGTDFPRFEVNYEQSIVAPAVQFLCEVYLATDERKYLDCAETLLPALESFGGNQPHYRMNEIAIRHWDGFWFGKRQTYGDVFPHYWSAITAAAYHYYALSTGKTDYQRRAEKIVDGNLANFFNDGRATCAFVYPRCVNGQKANYADAYANDQDWALVYMLLVKPTL